MSSKFFYRLFGPGAVAFLSLNLLFTIALAEEPVGAVDDANVAEETLDDQNNGTEVSDPESIVKRAQGEQVLTDDELNLLKELYGQLGSSNFQARETATSRLIDFGAPAIKPLKELQAEAKTPEVIARSQLVIEHIERSGMLARIELFMLTPGNVDEHKFYGWNAFSQVVGTGRMSRHLFILMLARHDRLCNEELNDEQILLFEEKFVRLLQEDIATYNMTSIADAVVAQYLMVKLQDKSSPELEAISGRLVRTAPYSSEINAVRPKTLMRLTGRWINTVQRDPSIALIVGLDLTLPEGAVLARKTLSTGDTGDQNYGPCMQTLMVQGTMQDLDLVERFFDDTRVAMKESVFFNGEVSATVQEYRDLALAVAVRIRGYVITDYFPAAQIHSLRGINPQTIIFTGHDPQSVRKAAFERYHAAVAADKDKTDKNTTN